MANAAVRGAKDAVVAAIPVGPAKGCSSRETMRVTHILLTGAGFTANWGGWLAKEMEGDLLQRLSDDDELHTLVQSSTGFEEALASLQLEVKRGTPNARAKYDRLKRAVLGSFREMNLALAKRVNFSFSNSFAFSVTRFLARFDAIFTLNQDLLLELHYDPQLADSRQPRWNSCEFRGVGGNSQQALFRSERVDLKRRVTGPPFAPHNLSQPIYKLHGSVDWFDSSGDFLIVGGGKEELIREKPLLTGYFNEFKRRLRESDARIMIIGYSFCDMHINQILADAWKENGTLSAFYVDPVGRKVIQGSGAMRSTIPTHIPPWGFIKCIGESTRYPSVTFSGADDGGLELHKLEKFFK
jgi:hypothetical protein